jgi:hypothetical protein
MALNKIPFKINGEQAKQKVAYQLELHLQLLRQAKDVPQLLVEHKRVVLSNG